jgi:hypothetical protein
MPKTSRKQNKAKRSKRYKSKKYQSKRYKGGFNSAQLAGALAVATALGMDRIVLIPNANGVSARSQRQEIVHDPSNPLTIRRGQFDSVTIDGSRFNIKNFDIYVGSSGSSMLMRIQGNSSVVARLAAITTTVARPDIRNALTTLAQGGGLVEPPTALALVTTASEPIDLSTLDMDKGADPQYFNRMVHILLMLLDVFFKFLLKLFGFVLSAVASRFSRPSAPQPPLLLAADAAAAPEISSAVVAVVNRAASVADADASAADASASGADTAADAANTINALINEFVDSAPQYVDNGIDVTPVADTSFKCVTPYDRGTASIKDRTKSCNQVGPPDANFVGRTWPVRQNCVNECFKP